MNAAQARKIAIEEVEVADRLGHSVADTTVVGLHADGTFWVTDNGEQVEYLTKAQAIEIIVENLAQPQVAIVEFTGPDTDAMTLFPFEDGQYYEDDDATTGRIYLADRDDLTAAQEQYLNTSEYVIRFDIVDEE